MGSLETLSPLDGRYRSKTSALLPYFSDFALFKYRVFVEIEYLISFLEITHVSERSLIKVKPALKGIQKVSRADYELCKKIETAGYKKIEATNHDVKAVEYFVIEKLKRLSLKDITPYVHFALTSEDTNSIAYALMASESLKTVVIPQIKLVHAQLRKLSKKYATSVLLARTHGQAASPTTFGKEINVFANRVAKQLTRLNNATVGAKLSGATGTYAAHAVAFPNIDWLKFSKSFIEDIGIKRTVKIKATPVTTQIEPHDSLIEVFDIIRLINNILIGLDQDLWRYISVGLVEQKTGRGEVGSSTMPHKINPIDFENSEGNLGIANSILSFLSNKLPISRLQRDLSDSTVLRNIGTAFGYCLVGYQSLFHGLNHINFSKSAALDELNAHPEVLAEAVQVLLKKEGVPNAFELLKQHSRGKKITLVDIANLVDTLNIDERTKQKVKSLKPADYIGLAETLSKMEE